MKLKNSYFRRLRKLSENSFCIKQSERKTKNQDKQKSLPKYMKFFMGQEEMMSNENIQLDINRNSKYFKRIVDSKIFGLGSKIRFIKIKNVPVFYYNRILEKCNQLTDKLHLDSQSFISLNFMHQYSHKIQSNYHDDILINNKEHILNFENFDLLEKMDILLFLDLKNVISERYLNIILEDIKEQILSEELIEELRYYYNFYTLLDFCSVYLPKYLKPEIYEKIISPEFLNKIEKKLDISSLSLIDRELYANFISFSLFKKPMNYIMKNFLDHLFMKM